MSGVFFFFFSDAKQKIGEGRSSDSLMVADLGREWPEGSRGEELSLLGALLGERRGLKGVREVNKRVPGLSAQECPLPLEAARGRSHLPGRGVGLDNAAMPT